MKSLFSSKGKRAKVLEFYKFLASLLFWKDIKAYWFQYTIEISSNIQIISMILFAQFKNHPLSSSETIPSIIKNISQVLSLMNIFDQDSKLTPIEAITTLFCLYFAVLLITLGYFLYCWLTEKKVSKTISSYFTYWAQIHHSLLFWIITSLMFSMIVNCKSSSHSPSSPLNKFAQSTGFILMSCFILFFNYLFAGFSAIYCYDPFPTDNLLAAYSSTFQMSTFFYKGFAGFLYYFVSDLESEAWVFGIISLLILSFRYGLLLNNFPYFNYNAMRLLSLFAGCTLGLALVNVLGIILFRINSSGVAWLEVLFFELLIVLFSLKLTGSQLQSTISEYNGFPYDRLHTKSEVFKKMFAMDCMLNRATFSLGTINNQNRICNAPFLNLLGELSNHDHHKENCICGHLKLGSNNIFGVHKVQEDYQTRVHQELFERATKQTKSNIIFKLFSVFLMFKKDRAFSSAVFTLISIDKSKIKLKEEILLYFIIHQFEEEIALFFKNYEENRQVALDIKALIEYERKSDLLFMLIEENTNNFIKLWTYYKKQDVALAQFVQKSNQIEKAADKTQAVWEELSINYKHLSKHFSPLYGLYLTLVRNMPCKGDKISREYNPFLEKIMDQDQQGRNKKQIDGRHRVLFYVSMSREKLGRVVHASRNIFEELGWSRTEVVGQNIKIIQPPFIKEKHGQILLNHLDSNTKMLSKSSSSFIQLKDGYIIPANIYVTLAPYVDNEPIYMGVITREKTTGDFMVITPNGMIDCFTRGLNKTLGLKATEKIHINQICKNWDAKKLETTSTSGIGGRKSLTSSSCDTERKSTMEQEPRLESLSMKDKEEITLNFISKDRKTEIVYTTRIQTQQILGETFLYLNLHHHKTLKNPQAFRNILENIEEESGNIPNEMDGDRIAADASDGLASSLRKIFPKLSPITPELNQRELKSMRSYSNDDSELEKDISLFATLRGEGMIKMARSDFEDSRSSVRARKDLSGKMEKAVYVLPRQRYLRVLDYLITLFAIICAGLVCLHLVEGRQELKSVIKKFDLIAMTQKLTLSIVSTNTNTRVLTMINRGLASDTRHVAIGVTSSRVSRRRGLTGDIVNLINFNYQVQQNLTILDDKSKQEIYGDLIRVHDVEGSLPVRWMNTFEMLIEVANAAARVAAMDVYQVNVDKPDVLFVLNNTLNAPLIASEKIVQIVIKDCKDNLYRVKSMVIIFLAVAVISGTSILLLLIVDLKKFLNNRGQFIEILLRMDGEALQKHLQIVTNFYYCLHNNVMDYSVYVNIREKVLNMNHHSSVAKRDWKRVQYKTENFNGLNRQMTRGIIFTFVTIIIYTSVFILLDVIFQLDLDLILGKIDRMVRVNQFNIDLNILNVGAMEFISENNSTMVLNQPIEKALDSIFDEAKMIPQFFTSFADETHDLNGPLLQKIMKGDLCSVVLLPYFPSSICYRIADQIGAEGLIRMLSFLVQGHIDVISTFEQSNRTAPAAFVAFNATNKVLSEQLSAFPLQAYVMIQDILKSQLKQSVIDHENKVITIIIVYVIIYAIFGWILSVKVWRNIKQERRSWRKIMRQIPYPIVATYKPLKTYLIKNCDGFLDSVKSSL